MVTRYFIITGTVQGVGFRYFARKHAGKKIKGYVKNLSDGSVAVLAQGTEEDIHNLFEHCAQGPFGASVTNIIVKELTDGLVFQNFTIEY